MGVKLCRTSNEGQDMPIMEVTKTNFQFMHVIDYHFFCNFWENCTINCYFYIQLYSVLMVIIGYRSWWFWQGVESRAQEK